MIVIRFPKVALMAGMALLVIGLPVLADELRGTVKSIDGDNSRMVVHDELAQRDVVLNFNRLTGLKSADRSLSTLKDLKPGAHVSIMDSLTASKVTVEQTSVVAAEQPEAQMIAGEFWYNFRHNLFKPLLLFFYLGFLVPILRVHFEFPYVMYPALTIYLLIAIGWHGGEELAHLEAGNVRSIVGFMLLGFLTNILIGILAYTILRATTRMRRIDQATVAGYYGSDSAGTFVTALGVLTTAHIRYGAYMPVMLAVMEIPGCLVALYLIARLRNKGMDALGNMADEPGYDPGATLTKTLVGQPGHHAETKHEAGVESELEMALERMEHPDLNGNGNGEKKPAIFSGKLLHEVFLNTGLYLLFGGIIIGLISGLQGPEVTRRRQLLRDAVPGRALSVPARNGHDGLPEAQGPEIRWLALRRLWHSGSQPVRDPGDPGGPCLFLYDRYSFRAGHVCALLGSLRGGLVHCRARGSAAGYSGSKPDAAAGCLARPHLFL